MPSTSPSPSLVTMAMATTTMTMMMMVMMVVMLSGSKGQESKVDPCRREFWPRRSGDNGYKVSVVGNPSGYKANHVYTVSISGTFPNQTFAGFALSSVPRHAVDEGISLGTLQNIDPKKSKSLLLCPHVITQAQSRERKEEVEILWTAPPTGSGCVEFRATVEDEARGWFKDEGALTRILCEREEHASDPAQNDQPLNPGSAETECCACGSAKYEMTFEGVWSQESHPRDYPTHRRLLHWSNIVGASHSKRFRIWEYGGYATKGVREVCEFGYPRSVEEEVKRSSREVRTIIKTTGIWWKDPVGIVQNRSARFTTDRRRHYVSMITMLGPSPDWCVGISAENLCLPNCTWSEGFVVDLLPWDAGTDNGVTYMAPNSKTDPQQRIRPITNEWPNDPRSPFYGPEPIKPLARLKIEKLSPREEPKKEGGTGECPDDATVEFDFFGEGESAVLDAEKKREEAGGGKCEVLPWEDWSGCSVTCGVGTRMRRRSYKNPEATEGECSLPLVERENCIGIENECETDDDECAVTLWSDWSPCSVTCGKGVVERRRYYLAEGSSHACSRVIEQVRDCVGAQVDCGPVRKSHEICSLPSLRGPCRGNFQRWFYDRRSKKCQPFQYGGCRGNGNRFETEEECEASCAEDDEASSSNNSNDACLQPSEPGTCGKRIEMWYFDRDMLKCLPFLYSGCGGNRNRFKTMDECTDACQSAVAIGAEGGAAGDRCSLPAVPGPCRDLAERWYFDVQMQKCLPFDYGGCQGNENNFRSMDECTESCQLASGVEHAASDSTARCSLPSEQGPCREALERWYFDVQMQKCLPFDYGGCGGNQNNFRTMDECTESCQLAGGSSRATGVLLSSARCGLPPEEGPCRAWSERWYFDLQMQKCLPFEYGGCGGNANNFQTMDECSESCRAVESASGGDGAGSRCRQPSEPGPCAAFEQRWYFDVQMEKCLPFEYGGCQGNENNFKTMDECTEACRTRGEEGEREDEKEAERCKLPSDRGPCGGSLERWYFDSQMEKCLPFEYGGCQGNANNFASMDECSNACQIDRDAPSVESVTPSPSPPPPPFPPTPRTAGRFKRFCTFEKERGPCRGNLERWYFDHLLVKCLPFHYGGCGGNANNFHSADECMVSCKDSYEEQEPNRIHADRRQSSSSSSSLDAIDGGRRRGGSSDNGDGVQRILYGQRDSWQTTRVGHNDIRANNFHEDLSRCSLEPDPGPCTASVQRWHFESRMEKCLPFRYGGCLGNGNNFQDMYSCMGACHLLSQRLKAVAAGSTPSPSGRPADRCSLPADTGPCRSNLERWHFDSRAGTCLVFQYGGCGGNENNFHNRRSCAEACGGGGGGPEVPGSTTAGSSVSRGACLEPVDPGPCDRYSERWHYDPATDRCLVFLYGGCHGNENRFDDSRSCLDACRLASPTTGGGGDIVSERCLLPPDGGPCKARIERWYYNVQLKSCLTFQYGGCGGNGNSFGSYSACNDTCRSGSASRDASTTPAVGSRQTKVSVGAAGSSTPRGAVDCRMSGWSDWSTCSASCGNGHRSRQREVLVKPSGGGKQCSKSLVRKQKCKLPPCENECQYGQWSQWSSCTKSCGYGSYRQRVQKPVLSGGGGGGGGIKCIDRVQRAICELPKCRY